MEELPIPIHTWLHDLMIYSLCVVEDFDEVLWLLERRMKSDEHPISPTLWSHALDTASQAMHYPLTAYIFRTRVEPQYLNPSLGMLANILAVAARHRDVGLASSSFNLLFRRSDGLLQDQHYETLLETYLAADDLKNAIIVLTTMAAAGESLSESSTRHLYRYLCRNPFSTGTAKEMLSEIKDEGREVPIEALNTLIESRIFHRSISDAIEIYKSMQSISPNIRPNQATFALLLRGCAHHRFSRTASLLVDEMRAMNVRFNGAMYDRLVLECVNNDNGMERVFRKIQQMGEPISQPTQRSVEAAQG